MKTRDVFIKIIATSLVRDLNLHNKSLKEPCQGLKKENKQPITIKDVTDWIENGKELY